MAKTLNKPGELTAFGEATAESKTPEVQLEFPYGINTNLVKIKTGGSGSVSSSENFAVISTGAATNSAAFLFSRDTVKYNPGQGTKFMGTAIFTTGVAGSSQFIGIGNSADGFFFGYSGINFGTLRRYGGEFEIRDITITAGASSPGNLSIVLNSGTAILVAVLGTDTIKQVVDKIVATSFATSDGGWEVFRKDNTTITFVANIAGVRAGTYSFSAGGTGATASAFSSIVSGVAPTDYFTPQTSWNMDKMGGPEHSRINMTLLPYNGNVYKIQYQWLGFGPILYSIEDSEINEFQLVNVIKYPNTYTTTSIKNASIPICAYVENTTNNTNIVLKVPSLSAFTEGIRMKNKLPYSTNASKAVTTENAVITLKNKIVYASKSNRIQATLNQLTVSTDGAKPVLLKVYKNTNVSGSVAFTDIDTSNSVTAYDTAGTTISGGQLLFTFSLGGTDSKIYDLEKFDWKLYPGEILTFTATSQNSNTVQLGLIWSEEF